MENHPHDYADPRARQEGGDHYLEMGIQPWDAMRAWLSPEQFAGYLLGNVIKYTARFNAKSAGAGKGWFTDLLKASHYLDQLIALEAPNNAARQTTD